MEARKDKMSFIRALEERRYSNGTSGLYVIPIKWKGINYVDFLGDGKIPSEDFCEIMVRILHRAGISFTLKDVNKIRAALFLEPLIEIKDEYESVKAYFDEDEYKALRKGEDD